VELLTPAEAAALLRCRCRRFGIGESAASFRVSILTCVFFERKAVEAIEPLRAVGRRQPSLGSPVVLPDLLPSLRSSQEKSGLLALVEKLHYRKLT
jgi:hypothetical protein